MTTDHRTIRRRRMKELPLIIAVIAIGGWLGLQPPKSHLERVEEAAELFDAGDRAASLRILEEVLASDPGFARAHIERARIALVDGEPETAESHLRSATEADPQSAEAWGSLGMFLFQTHRVDEAGTALERAIAVDRLDAQNYALLGQVLELRGQIADAHPHFEQARRLEPGVPLYWLLEARIQWKRFDPARARTALAGAKASAERPFDAAELKLLREIEEDLEIWPEGPPNHPGIPTPPPNGDGH